MVVERSLREDVNGDAHLCACDAGVGLWDDSEKNGTV